MERTARAALAKKIRLVSEEKELHESPKLSSTSPPCSGMRTDST